MIEKLHKDKKESTGENSIELPAMELIWDPAKESRSHISDDLNNFVGSLDLNNGVYLAKLELSNDQEIEDPSNLHPFIDNIIKRSLSYESSVADPVRGEEIFIDVRVQTPDSAKMFIENEVAQKPHFDVAKNSKFASYVLVSAIPTIQITGSISKETKKQLLHDPEGIDLSIDRSKVLAIEDVVDDPSYRDTSVSSILPLKLYRFTEEVLHSQPFLESWNTYFQDLEAQPRIFVRIMILGSK